MTKVIETKNAVYVIGYEMHSSPNRKVVDQRASDAFIFEEPGIHDISKQASEQRVTQRLQGTANKPPVFLVDVQTTAGQIRESSTRTWASIALKGLVALGAGREVRKAWKKRRQVAQDSEKTQKLSRMQKIFNSRAGKWVKKTRGVKVLSQFSSKLKSKAVAMKPGRRKFLKGAAGASLIAASEAISPEILRQVPQTRGLAENLDKDFVVAGRNAIIAQRLEAEIAPRLAQKLGRKPIITVALGMAHRGFEAQLKDANLRQKTINRFEGDIRTLMPGPANSLRHFTYDTLKGEYVQQPSIRVPSLVSQRAQQGARIPNRREFLAKAGKAIFNRRRRA